MLCYLLCSQSSWNSRLDTYAKYPSCAQQWAHCDVLIAARSFKYLPRDLLFKFHEQTTTFDTLWWTQKIN